MKIALIDVDGHNFPNLPLMKLSAWHKAKGDSVEWYEPLFSENIDICYMSKVFTFTPDYIYPVDAKNYKEKWNWLFLSTRWGTIATRNRTYLSRLFNLF